MLKLEKNSDLSLVVNYLGLVAIEYLENRYIIKNIYSTRAYSNICKVEYEKNTKQMKSKQKNNRIAK